MRQLTKHNTATLCTLIGLVFAVAISPARAVVLNFDDTFRTLCGIACNECNTISGI